MGFETKKYTIIHNVTINDKDINMIKRMYNGNIREYLIGKMYGAMQGDIEAMEKYIKTRY